MTGISGNEANDAVYHANIRALLPNLAHAVYKNIFGESYTASALGIYAAAVCLQKGEIPAHLMYRQSNALTHVRRILFYNHCENKNHTFVLLTSC
jgi:hypothetical protein